MSLHDLTSGGEENLLLVTSYNALKQPPKLSQLHLSREGTEQGVNPVPPCPVSLSTSGAAGRLPTKH